MIRELTAVATAPDSVLGGNADWANMTPRLSKSGPLPDDARLIERMLSVAKK